MTKLQSTGSTFKLLKDPYVMLAFFVLLVASTVTAVVETGMPIWMMKTMRIEKWQYGSYQLINLKKEHTSPRVFEKGNWQG